MGRPTPEQDLAADNEYLRDVHELGEARAERFADEHIDGDTFLCPGCSEIAELAESVPQSADPYAPPICLACASHQHGGG